MNVDKISHAVVDRAIDQTAARMRTVSALAGALLTGAGVIGYVAFAVIADHVVEGGLPLHLRRAGLALAGIAAAVLTAICVIRPAFRRINELYSAWLLERARPDLRHAVTTTLLLRGRNEVHAGVSSGLAFQAARAVRRIDATGVVSDRSLRHSGMVIIAVIASFCLYGLLAPKQIRPSVLRVLGADVAAPTQTSIEIIAPAPDASVVVGTPVKFEVVVKGRIPGQAWIEFSTDEGRTWPDGKRINLESPGGMTLDAAHWTATREGVDVAATFWYRVHAGDALCETRKHEVRPQPVATRHEVMLTWPDYANRTEPVRSNGPIDALSGAKAELLVRTNVPASDARVVFHDAGGSHSRQMSIDGADRQSLRASWIVDRDLEYEVRFNDLHGAGNDDPIRYTQRARGDRAAEITQAAPPASFTAMPTDVFQVQARVVDDWGIVRVVLAYRGLHGAGVIELTGREPVGRPIVEIDTTVSVEALAAQPGDIVELHIEATDTRVNLRGERDPQVSRGPACELRVIGGKGSSNAGNSQRPGGGSGPSQEGAKNGNQPSNQGKNGSGSDGNGNESGKAGEGDKPGESKAAGEKTAPSSEAGDANADQPGASEGTESSKPDAGAASDEKTETSSPENGSPPDSSKPTPTNERESTRQGDADAPSEPAEKPNGHPDTPPSDGGESGESPNAQAELDRLIRKNQDVLERLSEDAGKKEGGMSGDSQESKDPGEGSAKPSKNTGAQKNSTEKKGQPSESGSDGAEKPGDKSKSNSNSNDDTKSSDGSKPDAGQSGQANSGDEAGASKGASPPQGANADDPASATDKPPGAQRTKGSADRDAPQPAGEAEGEGEAKPGDGQPSDTDEQGKADSGKFAKNPANDGTAKDKPPGASTPRPAEGEGPTPQSSGGGVAEDAGPSQADGTFAESGKGDSLDAPLRERARKAVDELERRLRDGGVSDAELRDLGWSRAEARNFVSRYRRLQKAAQQQRDGGLFSGRVRESNGESKVAAGDNASGVGRGMGGAVRGASGDAKDGSHAGDAPAESVPPELQDVLEEYYRSMARQDGAKPKTKSNP